MKLFTLNFGICTSVDIRLYICLYSGDFVFYTVSGTVVNPDPKVRSSKGYAMRHCAVLLNMTSISGFATDTWPCIQQT
jgi:hypothetical protein